MTCDSPHGRSTLQHTANTNEARVLAEVEQSAVNDRAKKIATEFWLDGDNSLEEAYATKNV